MEVCMATIRPSSDLRNKYNEISEFCNKYNEPVFITKNGTGDLVVLSNAEYERLWGKQELYRLLNEGLEDVKAGRSRPAEDVFADIERKLGFGGL
jgi:prevent-host-death family protein